MLGDARLTMADSTDRYDVLILDAFSSDAIPAHLLTREAFAVYREHLSSEGVIVVHKSNRHLNLEPVLAAEAAAENVTALVKYDRAGDMKFKFNANVVVLAQNDSAALGVLRDQGWRVAKTDPTVPRWTDDYSNVLWLIVKQYLVK